MTPVARPRTAAGMVDQLFTAAVRHVVPT
ncbi:hypothetical protein XAP412_320039 [Xanthomonas phaseoli pv. phaseoli]|uniref:Uncharacterized protein n=1 Tax=Xanthomonas campestris pv. phaseoli TaxID=317013 RepID=A0AB38E1L4_XANCH|nr:hypothetical protein XAP412_320039 [Xanthomonas phaseoli pv. phaseoli]SON88233.1 hypothetical protein XAP7430_360039 [Xanthomonas phaseoli pv. phaseoli]